MLKRIQIEDTLSRAHNQLDTKQLQVLLRRTIAIVGIQHLKEQGDGVRFNLSNPKITDEQIREIHAAFVKLCSQE